MSDVDLSLPLYGHYAIADIPIDMDTSQKIIRCYTLGEPIRSQYSNCIAFPFIHNNGSVDFGWTWVYSKIIGEKKYCMDRSEGFSWDIKDHIYPGEIKGVNGSITPVNRIASLMCVKDPESKRFKYTIEDLLKFLNKDGKYKSFRNMKVLSVECCLEGSLRPLPLPKKKLLFQI